MGFSQYLSEKVMGQFLNGTAYTWPTTVYVALFTVQPSGGTGGTEADYTGYARVAMTVGTTDFTAVSTSGEVQNAIAINFPTNTGTAQTVVGYGFFDASTGGDLLTDNTLTSSQTINNGASASFAAGALTLTATINP
jgi:hypothetical protein